MSTNKPFRPYVPYGDTAIKNDPKFGVVWVKDVTGMPVIKSKSLADRICYKPFTWLEVDMEGRCWVCCPSWLPYNIGNIQQSSIRQIWNGELANFVRQTILDGSFSLCNEALCPVIASDSLPKRTNTTPYVAELPTHVNFSNDESCNLYCPSCRTSKIIHADGELYEKRKAIHDKLISELFDVPHNNPINLFITGSGDPFGSKIFREFLFSFDPTPWPQLTLSLQTNGVMFTPKNWDKIHLWHSRIRDVRVSFDASSAETYSITRSGGDWDTLLANCKHLNDQVQSHGQIRVYADFVVQDVNYHEMLDYAKMVLHHYRNFSAAHFSLVTDWGTWDTATYQQRAIWKETHPDHRKFVNMVRSIPKHPKIVLGNLTRFAA